jgi:hypothetical protein
MYIYSIMLPTVMHLRAFCFNAIEYSKGLKVNVDGIAATPATADDDAVEKVADDINVITIKEPYDPVPRQVALVEAEVRNGKEGEK